MSPKRKAAAVTAELDASPDGKITHVQIQQAYGLVRLRSAKKLPKHANPMDLGTVIAAAKKEAKTADAKRLRELGEDPASLIIASKDQKTGLRNLGATCYMNSLLQCLFMDPIFRRGIYQWRAPEGAELGAAASAAADGSRERPLDGEADPPPLLSREAVATEVVRQLQQLFASLHKSTAVSYDPAALTQALSLDVGVQQDAQEFNKLFLSLVEEQLALSTNPSLRMLVKEQFAGEFAYRTVCKTCDRASASSATRQPFYELELNLQPSLEMALEDYVAIEDLLGTGWQCAPCGVTRDAARQVALLTLPPVLCFQLLRFVFDLQTLTKKKVSTPITFPEVLDMKPYLAAESTEADTRYRLTAVLMHIGTSAHAGHYTARIYNQLQGRGDPGTPVGDTDGDGESWWTFNDESVLWEGWHVGKASAAEKSASNGVLVVGDTAAGTDGGRTFESRTAYMLRYTRESALNSDLDGGAIEPPPELLQAVLDGNEGLRARKERYDQEKEANARAIDKREKLKAELMPLLEQEPPCAVGEASMAGGVRGGHGGPFHWICEGWLQRCLAGDPDDVGAIDNSGIACSHNNADPNKIGSMRLVPPKAWEYLQKRFGGGPPLPEHGCEACVRALLVTREGQKREGQLADDLASGLAAERDGASTSACGPWYHVPKRTAKLWHKWRSEGITDATAEITCKHGSLCAPSGTRQVDARTWGILKQFFPSSTPFEAAAGAATDECPTCRAAGLVEAEGAREASQVRKVLQTRLARVLAAEPSPLPLEALLEAGQVYLVDGAPLDEWLQAFKSGSSAAPSAPAMGSGTSALLCEHRQLLAPVRYARDWPFGSGAQHARERAVHEEQGRHSRLLSADEVAALHELKEFLLPADGSGAKGEGALPCTVTLNEAVACLADSAVGVNTPSLAEAARSMGGTGDVHCQKYEVCTTCSEARAAAALQQVSTYTDEVIFIQTVAELSAVQAEVPGAPADGGLLSPAAPTSADDGGRGADRPRRSTRRPASTRLKIKASGESTVNNLKLLIYEAAERAPSQQRLFFEARELDDDDALLADVGIVPGCHVHLFVDTSRPSDVEEALQKHTRQTGNKGGSQRGNPEEGGFLGSALLGGV